MAKRVFVIYFIPIGGGGFGLCLFPKTLEDQRTLTNFTIFSINTREVYSALFK